LLKKIFFLDGCCFIIEPTDSIKQMFHFQSGNTPMILSTNSDQRDKENVTPNIELMSNASNFENNTNKERDKWSRSAILHLISCYEKFKNELTSMTIKREEGF